MASSGKKNKKKKKTAISINGPGIFNLGPQLTESFADQSEVSNELLESIRNVDTGLNLPKAPRSTRECEYDTTAVPTAPPFQAHLTNIPFDFTEDEIKECFRDFDVVGCSLPRDVRHGSNRLKGYGYIEFADRQNLIDALCIGEKVVKTRKMKIDLPGKERQDYRDRQGRDMQSRQMSNRSDMSAPGDPDRTESDWRNEQRAKMSSDNYRNSDRPSFLKRSGFDSEKPREIDNESSWRGSMRENPPKDSEEPEQWRSERNDKEQSSSFERRGDRNGFDRTRDRDGFDRIRDRDGFDRIRDRDDSTENWRDNPRGERESRAFNKDGFDRKGRGFDRRDRDRDDGSDRRDRDGGFERRGMDRDRDRDRMDRDRDRDRMDRDRDRDKMDRDRDRDKMDRDRDRDRMDRDRDRGKMDRDRDGDKMDRDDRDWRDEARLSAPPPSTKRDGSASPLREVKKEELQTRKPLNLKPRSAPIVAEPETVSKSVFGSAKPVDTAAKERELEEKWNRERSIPSSRHNQNKDKDSEVKSSKENEPPRETQKILEPAPPPKENAWAKRRPQQTSNNGHTEPEESKPRKEIDSETKNCNEEIISSNESKTKVVGSVESAPKDVHRQRLKDNNSANDVRTASHQQVNDSKKTDDRNSNSKAAPPKNTEKSVKSQEQPTEDGDSSWSTKVSRVVETGDDASRMLKAKEQRPPNFVDFNVYSIIEEQ